MKDRDPERNFEELWSTFNKRYPFFDIKNVDWQGQYTCFRPHVNASTTEPELFDLLCRMLAPLDDGHVNLRAKINGEKHHFRPETKPRFWQEFTDSEIKDLFETTAGTLRSVGFGTPAPTAAWMLLYCRSQEIGYIRILELEGVKKKHLKAALNDICRDLTGLKGFIIDIRNCPGGDDSTAIEIVDRFCDRRRVAFHRRTKKGPGENEVGPLKTWFIEPKGEAQFTGPIVLLTCDSVFSGGEAFALAIRELPYVTIMGDHTNGIFSYELERKLPNGWKFTLSYQIYYSAEMVCYEGRGVPADIEMFNTKADIAKGVDPLVTRAVRHLQHAAADQERN